MKLRTLITLAALLITPTILAQSSSGGEFTITKSVIASGGGSSSGGDFSVTGTLGQPEAAESQGGEFSLRGGYWTGGELPDLVFLDGFEG